MAKRGFTGAMTKAYGARDFEVTVTAIDDITPHFRRIWFHTEQLRDRAVLAPTSFLRFWFPDPEGSDHEFQRAYTLSAFDADADTFAVDMVLHEPEGPASAWARRAEIGSTVAATSLGATRFEVPEELPAGYLLVGDAASLPAIAAILEELPPEMPAEVYLEEHDPDDRRIPIPEHPRARVYWVPREGETSLAAAIEARDWSNWAAWVTPESGSLKHLRIRLRDEFGFPKQEVHAQAYWYFGRAFGKNRSKADMQEQSAAPQQSLEPTPAAPPQPARANPTPGSWSSQAGSRLLAPLKPTMIIAGIAQALITIVQLAPFVLLVELARELLAGADASTLWPIAWWAVGLTGGGIVAAALLMVWMHVVDATFARELRQRLLRQLGSVPLGWFDTHGPARIKQLVHDDTLALHYLVTHAIPDAVSAVVAPIVVLVYLFIVDWRIALLLLVPMIAYLVGMTIMVVQSGPRTAEYQQWAERMNVEAGAYLEGQDVIRVFGGTAASTFRARLSEYIEFLEQWQRPLSGQKTFIDLVTRPATFLLLIAFAGTALITTGAMAPLSLLPFLFLGTTFGARLMGIGYGLGGMRAGLAAARRLQVALDAHPLATREPQAPDKVAAGTVTFDGVSFGYRPGLPVLRDISLELRPGTVTALVGPSGSGKSTLAALLARFFDVDAGSIRINGRDVRELTSDELYAEVGFVFQDPQLVRGTVRENIALARPDATMAAVEEAARAAQIHERILAMSQGYDTELGPDAALSGGERQRLTIARALLADTPILVLDEATAFADPESEFEVQQALSRLTAGRTVLVIAHRLHTVTGADTIIVLDDGRIAESGTHAELLARHGRYRQLWDAGPIAVTRHTAATERSER